MRIEIKCVDNTVTFDQLLAGGTYRSTGTGLLYLAGVDSEHERTMTNLASGDVWYGTLPPGTKFTPVDAHLVVTKG